MAFKDFTGLTGQIIEQVVAFDAQPVLAEQERLKAESGNAPLIGILAVRMGLVPADLKNALVEAQAGARTLTIAQNLQAIAPAEEGVGIENSVLPVIRDSDDPARPARAHIGAGADEKRSQTSAQAINHLADLSAAMIAAEPKLAYATQFEGVPQALDRLGRHGLNSATLKLHGSGHAAISERFADAEPSAVSPHEAVSLISRVGGFCKNAGKYLHQQGMLSDQAAGMVNQMVEQRTKQARAGISLSADYGSTARATRSFTQSVHA